MGMDVHGLNPKINKDINEFPILAKYKKMETEDEENGFQKKWKALDTNQKERTKYWEEEDKYKDVNKGIYFRNNCWWWRPLWDFCYNVAPDLISEKLWESGHSNSGAGLNDKDAKSLGLSLFIAVKDGTADDFKKHHEEQEKDEEYKYPFDVENVEAFAEFCVESGGFEIC